MNNRVSSLGLYAFCLGLILLAGCFPEDSLDWSGDGSIGLLRTGEELYVVDGNTGALTRVPTDGSVSPWPDMSSDGKRIVYAEQVKYATLAEGLKALPVDEVRMIANDTKHLREKILSGVPVPPEVTEPNRSSTDDEYAPGYKEWIIRSLCENADGRLAQKLGDQVLQKGKEAELASFRIVVASRADLKSNQIIATTALIVVRPRFSPDGKHVAYVVSGPTGKEKTHLFVALSQESSTPMRVASNVSVGFDWRPDSQALAYLQQEGETMFATLREQRVCDPNGRLLDEASAQPAEPLTERRCTGESKQLAGTLFDQLLRVEYGVGGRLFFSSASGKIPSSDLDQPTYSLFYYDFATRTVADVLPSGAGNELALGEAVNFFSLSPDGKKVLLPMKKGRFAVYELGTKSFTTPIKDGEEFGKDMPKILPAWKGNDGVSLQISSKSHFLTEEQQKRGRNEVVVVDAAGNLKSVLSTGWPDEALPKD